MMTDLNTMNIIFLDFDGVLNSTRYFESLPKANYTTDDLWIKEDLDPEAIKLLNNLVEKTKAKIVVSSSWRILYSINDLCQILRDRGLIGDIVGAIPHYPGNKKEDDIWEWLDANKDYDQFVIFDDWDDEFLVLKRHLVLTNPDIGLCVYDILKAEKILSKK